MAGQPRHPGSGEDTDTGSAREPLTTRQRLGRVLLILAVVALFALMIVLHLTGVLGPGTHG